MNDILKQDVVYDVISRRFRKMTYLSQEKLNNQILDSIMLLPIRKSDDEYCVNIYRVKRSNTIIKIRYYRKGFNSISEYKGFIDGVLAAHGRTRKDIVLVKKIVDSELHHRCLEAARPNVTLNLLDIYGWRYI